MSTAEVRDASPLSSSAGTKAKIRNIVRRVVYKHGFVGKIQSLFGRFAVLVYDFPWLVIFATVIITLALGTGLIFHYPETDAERLYALPQSRAVTDRDLMVDTFGPPGRVSAVFLMSNELGETNERVGLLTRDFLGELAEFDREIKEDVKGKLSEEGDGVSFGDVCYRDSWGDCRSMSVLDMYQQEVQRGKPLVTNDYPLIVNRKTKKIYKMDLLLAKPTVISVPRLRSGDRVRTMVYNATGYVMVYHARDDPQARDASLAWEAALIQHVLSRNLTGVHLSVNAQRSWEDELVASTAFKLRDLFDYSMAFMLVC
eukprot:Selendium_serpulae@DN4608_c0_g1_i1.p1